MVSPDGGVEIEKVAEETPERIFKAFIDPALGLQPFQARELAFGSGLTGDQVGKAVKLMTAVYQAFLAADASLVEINPLIVTEQRRSAGARRQDDASTTTPSTGIADLKALRDLGEEEPLEIEASKFSLNYIKLDGIDRLHGERRRARDGDDGHHQARRWRAGELPRCRRRRQRRADQERLPHPDVGREREAPC